MDEKRIIRPENYPWDPYYMDHARALAVERHGILCVSGLTGEIFDEQRNAYLIENLSLLKQMQVIFDKLETIIHSAGYDMRDVVYTVDYALQAGLPEYRKTAAIRKAVFGEVPPAAVGVLVEGIPSSAALLTMNAVAMKDGKNKRVVIPRDSSSWKRYNSLTFSPGFYVGDSWFWMSGTTGRIYDKETGKDVYPKGIEAQDQAIWQYSLGEILMEAGITPDSVVRTADYVHPAAIDDYRRKAYSRSLPGKPSRCVREVLVVNRLLKGDALLETDATCYLGLDKEIISSAGVPGISAVRCGKVVFCRSQGPIDHMGQFVVGKGYFRAQVDQTYQNLEEILQSVGGSLKDVVRTIEITSPQSYYQQPVLDQTRKKRFGNALPAVTTVTGNSLLQNGADFSLDAWAILP